MGRITPYDPNYLQINQPSLLTQAWAIEYNEGMRDRKTTVAIIDLTPDDGYVSCHLMAHGFGHFTPRIKFGLALSNHLAQFNYPAIIRYTDRAQQKLFGKPLTPGAFSGTIST